MSNVMELFSDVNTMWVLVGAALVFFMQAGFAMVETGFTRAKNAGNIIMKNLMDFCIGTPLYWLVGFGIMFGGSGALFGGLDLLGLGDYSDILPQGVSKYTFFIFQTVFCATAATIVSGAMAERTKFSAYCLYSGIISLVIYPISGHWIWGGGWLASLEELTGGALPNFHDFAGSTAVHMVGGLSALIGAAILGPRLGKYVVDKQTGKKKSRAIPGHSIPLGALGVFILWFCWFGFNGASTVSMTNGMADVAGSVFFTTNLAAAVATCTVLIITWVRYKKPDVSMTLNGSLAGLVAITAGCDAVDPVGAFFIGLISGFVVVFGIEFIDKVCKIDDPVGAVGVHCLCGAAGTIMVGLFSCGNNGNPLGLFYGGGFAFLGAQLIGVLSVAVYITIAMTIVFLLIKRTVGLRVSKEEEILGLDSTEHGLTSAYADFASSTTGDLMLYGDAEVTTLSQGANKASVHTTTPVVAPEVAVPVVNVSSPHAKMTKIVILTKQSKFEALKNALDKIQITGMTVSQVLGCGMQKGRKEYYRGVPVETTLLPKVKVEIVVAKIPVQAVVDVVKSTLYTGSVGDGKIFIYDVENVIKVRTGEEGYDALQDEE